MALLLDGSGSITGLSAGGLPDSSITAADIADGAITSAKLDTTTSQLFGMRNRIINGDMRIDQRNAGASVTIPTSNPTYSLDRWGGGATQNSKFTIQQNAGSVTPPDGFTKYLGVTSSSAYSVLSTDYFYITQRIEGFNFADLGFGTANAQTITISFWVRSSLTGTFGGAFVNENYDRAYPFTYTISSANTWEKKTITIAGDTTGTWNTTNNIGAVLFLGLGVGSSNSGTAGAWSASGYTSATGATSVVGTNGATWYLTGVQLEVGSTATPFERRLYGTELDLCKRYYQQYSDYDATGVGRDTATAFFSYSLRPSMRAVPTATFTCTNVDRFGTAYVATSAAGVLDARENQATTYASATMSGRGEPCGPAGSLLKVNAEL